MKDLDFEELDRAVTSLTNERKEMSESDQSQKAMPRELEANNEALQRNSNTTVAGPELDKAPTTSSSPSVHPTTSFTPSHRSGRLDFRRQNPGVRRGVIDIMAPKPSLQQKPFAPVRQPSRVGVTMQPVSNHNGSPLISSAPSPLKSPADIHDQDRIRLQQARDQFRATTNEKERPAGNEKWPDPLDFHGEEEQASPFLPGAKVAKRPLGAYTEHVSDTNETPAEAVEKPIQPEKALIEIEATIKEEQPQEATLPVLPNEPKITEEETSVASTEPAIETEPAFEAPVQRPAEQQVRDSAMLSIPQQYRAPNKTASMSTRPLFDTKEYHPPLLEEISQTSRKSKMWTWLIVGLVVIILAVGGYFAFIYFVH